MSLAKNDAEYLEAIRFRYRHAETFRDIDRLADVGWLICTIDKLLSEEWIPCEERLPEAGVPVLICATNGRIDTDAVNKHDGLWECDDDWTVAFWRPLPAPPEKVGG